MGFATACSVALYGILTGPTKSADRALMKRTF